MRIVSTFLPPAATGLIKGRLSVVMAFDTLVGEKSHVVGITVGVVDGPDIAEVRVSQIGRAIIERCAGHFAQNYPDGAVVVAGVARIGGAKERVRQVLAKAPPDSFVLLVCADDKVYDAAFPALGVDFQSANVKPQ